MKKVGVVLVSVVALGGAYLLAHLALIEIGREVVVLRTKTPTGEVRQTRLWVVDHDGYPWVNGGGGVSWYQHLLERPDVEMTRGGETRAYRAVPVPEFHDQMHVLLRRKYGFADWWVRFLTDSADTVPVRLDPRAPRRE